MHASLIGTSYILSVPVACLCCCNGPWCTIKFLKAKNVKSPEIWTGATCVVAGTVLLVGMELHQASTPAEGIFTTGLSEIRIWMNILFVCLFVFVPVSFYSSSFIAFVACAVTTR